MKTGIAIAVSTAEMFHGVSLLPACAAPLFAVWMIFVLGLVGREVREEFA